MAFDELRKPYLRGSLRAADLGNDPLRALRSWLAMAADAGEAEANAMALATVGADGRPSVRFVLLKDVAEGGLTFFTNYGSRKARDLDASHHAALAFWWASLERQARVEGSVERLPRDQSEAYFLTRPYGSQIGAWASHQSTVLDGRASLEARAAELRARYPEGAVPCPPFWGGYLLRPSRFEFWQGRDDRLHDRFAFESAGDGGWTVVRLAP
ncbi:MAG: pyridoxamine 5'-phosphate oxidase [Trueperaceae bacterium]